MKAVFLDADSLSVSLRFPADAFVDYVAHGSTVVDQIVERSLDADVIITNKVPLRESTLADLPRLRRICVAATGVDCIDSAAATARGIEVVNVAGYATDSVAEHVIAMVMMHVRDVPDASLAAVDGRWSASNVFTVHGRAIRELGELTLGIIGRGAIGESVGRRATALGLRVLYASASGRAPSGDDECTLDELYRQSDVVSLHCPLTDTTHKLIGNKAIARMKPDAFLINTARGGLVDDEALIAALRHDRLGGAAIDVLDHEPPRRDHRLLRGDIPNLQVTPHVAWASRRAQHRLARAVVANVSQTRL